MSGVSVLVVSWNSCAVTLACLRSLSACRASCDMQVILSDNGSHDDTVAQVRAQCADVLVVENGRNLGFAAAINRAAQKATQPLLLLLNNDAQVEPQALRDMLDIMAADQGIGVLGPQLVHSDGRLQNSAAAVPSLATETLNKSLLKMLFPALFPGKFTAAEQLVTVPGVVGACLLTRTDSFRRLGGLSEEYFFYLEETDYCLRVQKAGLRVAVAPQIRVAHLLGHSANRVRLRARIEYHRSLFIFFRRQHGTGPLACLRIILFLQHAGKCLGTALALTLTLFLHARLRGKLLLYARLLQWQILGCPVAMGLRRDG